MKKFVLGALLAAFSGSARATPTGLNNIPTADTVPHRTVAVQAYDLFGSGPHDFAMGFKTGWDFSPVHLEWGLDSHLAPDPGGPLYFQTKLAASPWEKGLFAVGVANVPFINHERAGDPFTYAVLTHDFEFLRLSLGYGLQTDNNSVLLGVDRTWKINDHSLNLNADLVQFNDGENWLSSLGAKYELTKNIILETWVNLPDEGDVDVMAKINFVLTF